MATALRGHLLGAFLLLVVLGTWASDKAGVSELDAVSERLQEDLEALSSGRLPADEVPALAQWIFRDTTQSKEMRLQVLSAAVDAKLRHQVRLPARAEEDPLALLALALELQIISTYSRSNNSPFPARINLGRSSVKSITVVGSGKR